MKFTAIFIALATVIASAYSAPASSFKALNLKRDATAGNSTLSPDAQGDIYMCTDAGFGGTCTDVQYDFGECLNVPTGFNDKVSSIGPTSGSLCVLFKNINCDGNNIDVVYPGSTNLKNQGFNDVMSSFRCQAN